MGEETLLTVDDSPEDAGLEIYKECELDAKYRNPRSTLQDRLKGGFSNHCACNGQRCKNFFRSIFPILKWLPQYDIKENLLGDFAAGLTVGIVHIPQGLAYALLATLPPIVGIYVSLFPVLLYPIFGTSRHVSMGTFAIISILTSGVLDQRVPVEYCGEGGTPELLVGTTTTLPNVFSNLTENSTFSVMDQRPECEILYENRKIEVAIALSVCVGVLQILMHVFHLGIITVFLSDSLLSGFLCGASFLVITSQIPKLFGITVQRYSGPFALVYTYIDIFRHMPDVSWITVVLSVACTVFLVLGKEFNLRYKKKLPVPIPWELFIVILSTVASYFAQLEVKHDVATVGKIPKGISTSMPKGADVASVFFDSLPLAVVAFAVEISLCQVFARKHSYEIDPNQELLALGICNLFGAFFSCYPSASSLSRSVIYEEVGAKTQLGAYFSSFVVLTVLLWIGPLFQPLPQAALAVIIIVNIKSVALLWRNVKPLWRISRLDAVTWVFSWFSVIILGVAMGLMVGATFSIFTVLLRTRNVTGASLRKVSSTGVYRDSRKYSTVSTHDEILVYQFTGPLFFANKDRFTEQLVLHLGFDPAKEAILRKFSETSVETNNCSNSDKGDCSSSSNMDQPTIACNGEQHNSASGKLDPNNENRSVSSAGPSRNVQHGVYSHVIFDMSRCSFLDSDGSNLIRSLFDSFNDLNISLMLTSCSEEVKRSLKGAWKDREPAVYVSLEGAVQFAQNQQQNDSSIVTCKVEPARRDDLSAA